MDIRKEFPEYERISEHLRTSNAEWALTTGYRLGGALLALNAAIHRALQRAPRDAATAR